MKKILNKKIIICVLSFIIPLLIIFGNIVLKEIVTKGHSFYNGKTFLVADMGSQYNSLYHYFHNVLIGKDSIFYSFYNNMGGNMASTIGYYLSSPFNILYGFVKKSDITFMTVIIYSIKIALCSLFMNIYLCHKYGNKYVNLIFSLSYAFMGFITVYYFNSMWLDVIYMTPLVIMGIDKLIDGKPLMYIITLSLAIIFNFYFAYMLCIFCLIYFIYELFIRYNIKNTKDYDYIVKKFLISSLLGAGLSAFFLLPVVLNLSETFRFPIDLDSLKVDFINTLRNLISKSYFASHSTNSLLGRKRAVIYINLFSLILSIFYFMNNKISKKEKMLSLCIIGFFILSFMIPYLQLFWQGFSLPNGYIDRYSYLYCFFLILLASKQFHSNYLPKTKNIVLFLLVYVLISFIILSKNLIYVGKDAICVSVALVLIYSLLYIGNFKIKKIKFKKILSFLLVLFIFSELIYNYILTFIYMDGMHDENPFPSELCYKNKKDKSDFYRTDYYTSSGYLEGFTCDFYTTNSALSTNDGKLHKFMHNTGASLAYMYTSYDNKYLPILASLTGTKYLYGAKKIENNHYKKIKTFERKIYSNKTQEIFVYKNPYALSLGFVVDNNYYNNYQNSKKDNNTSYDNLNNIFKSLTGLDKDVLTKIQKMKIKPLVYKFYIDKQTDYLYFTADYDEVTNFSYYSPFYVNEENLKTLDTFNIGMYSFKNVYFNEEITLELDEDELINDINLYYFDGETFEEGINKLKEHQLENIVLNGNKLSGEIKLDRDSTLFLSIPYDKGWKVYVDGKRAKTVEIADLFMGIKVPKGSHKIYMKFYPRGLKLGIIISIISLSLIIYFKRKEVVKSVEKNKRKNNK